MASGSQNSRMSPGEISVYVALYVLGGEATVREIVETTGMNEQYVRNILRKLRLRGYVEAGRVSGLAWLMLAKAEVNSGKELIHKLTISFDEFVRKHRDEIIKWASPMTKDINEIVKIIEEKKRKLGRNAEEAGG